MLAQPQPGDDTELQRLRSELAERDDLLAFLAHELRNPMHSLALQLASARAQAEAAGVATIGERLSKAQATLARYTERATLLLDMAQHRQTAYPVSPKPTDLAALLARILDNARVEAEAQRTRLRLDAPLGCIAQTDPLALEHVLSNLLSNACKHAQCSEVVLSLRRVGEAVQIVVADDGRGISAEDQQRVFRKFDRGAQPSLRGGSGLGLWIARQLIQALDGTIALESRLNGGCRFILQIPLVVSPQPAPKE